MASPINIVGSQDGSRRNAESALREMARTKTAAAALSLTSEGRVGGAVETEVVLLAQGTLLVGLDAVRRTRRRRSHRP